MRSIFFAITAVNVTSNVSQAATCDDCAQFCMKNGGIRAVCFDAARMASCERTGSYVGAYSDKSFPATKSKYPVLAELGHSKRTTPPSRMMLGGVALNPDSAIPRWLFVCIERAKVQ